MKTAIPLGLVLLVAGAAAIHHSASPQVERKQPKSVTETVSQERREEFRASEEASVKSRAPESASAAIEKPAPPPPVSKQTVTVSWPKMIAQMDREVGLTTLQRSSMEELLKAREDEIKALHDGILRAGIVDIRRYDWQADLMKDAWYRKLDALLDREQHDRFVALIQKGFLNEGLAFTIEPGMTVLD